MNSLIQYILYTLILVALAYPLGLYIRKVMDGQPTWFTNLLQPAEEAFYKIMGVEREEQMNWKKYLWAILAFSGVGFVFLFFLQLLQGYLPANPQGLPGVSWHLSFNTTASFVSNTNWQSYNGESTLSYLSQALGLTVQNFVSAATGIASLSFASVGYWVRDLHWYERIALLAGAITLITPGVVTDLVGLGIMVAVYILQKAHPVGPAGRTPVQA